LRPCGLRHVQDTGPVKSRLGSSPPVMPVRGLREEEAYVTDDQKVPPFAEMVPFAGLIGIEVLSASNEEVRGRLPWAPERCTVGGVMHGGALMTLADTLGSACAFLNLPPGASTTTLESKTNFFRAVRDGHVDGVSRPLHVGRTTIVIQTDLHDGEGNLAGLVTQTQMVLMPS
jgi:1,4-dihydroxy-2-naphthoyl-CoA hydrolase